MVKCDFNKVTCIFSGHLFPRTPGGLLLWVEGLIFEKREKIRLDHEESITIMYFFAIEQVIIIKIWILRSHRQLDKK